MKTLKCSGPKRSGPQECKNKRRVVAARARELRRFVSCYEYSTKALRIPAVRAGEVLRVCHIAALPRRMAFAPTTSRRLVSEFVGTLLLLAVVVGSGVMGEAMSADAGIALLGNTLATGAALVVLILVFGPVSGAHFNPAVTLAFWLRREIGTGLACAYVAAQVAGALAGVWLAHLMFELDIAQVSLKARDGLGQWTGEAVATFALVLAILGTVKRAPHAVPYAVGLVIVAGYWFTSSTSFANPAVTLARSLSDTFAGIAPGSVPGFLLAQFVAAAGATGFWAWMEREG